MIYAFLKRSFDILFALIFIAVFSPIYILTALIIAVSSPGAPIYKAQRVGKDGKTFVCYKFRSMHKRSGNVRLTTLRSDERIFPFGHFIRKTKIDEFPQMFNILLGQMSVVGPRPEDTVNVEKYPEAFRSIHTVRPGLTSPASLYDYTDGEKCGSVEEYEQVFLPQKLAMERYYVVNRSLWYDFTTIIKTAVTILLIVLGKKSFKPPKELPAALAAFTVAEKETESIPR